MSEALTAPSRNMKVYVHVYPGHYQSHLAYASALLDVPERIMRNTTDRRHPR